MRGILLAGGYGTRLHPLTKAVSKHLLPVYNKPMIYYPLTTLMTIGVRDIVLITHPPELPFYQNILGNGSQWGIRISYKTQPKPVNIVDNFLLAEDFIENHPICLMLGDNIFYGDALSPLFYQAKANLPKTTIFTYHVKKPHQYGVVEFDRKEKPIRLIEKPTRIISHDAITGLFFYDTDVLKVIRSVKKENRYSFTLLDLNQLYLKNENLNILSLPPKARWFDAGTPDTLIEAANFVQACEQEGDFMVGSPEMVAWQQNYIDSKQLKKLIEMQKCSTYGAHLERLLISGASRDRVIS